MAVRLRLTRMGRKKKPYYRIIAVDSRAPRDGRYLENLGYYNPLPDPFELKINEERVLYWLGVGAIPSDTVNSLFRKEGILFKWDLVKRGLSGEELDKEMKRWEVIQLERRRKQEKKLEAKTDREESKEAPAEAAAEEVQEKAEETADAAPESGEAEDEKTVEKAS
ncbi:MAG TPA: 30S ribosomal protein S16 [Bacteroidetes bacterium]|nr:30S ribosomal protein S16 [Bacteroidota bacterium]